MLNKHGVRAVKMLRDAYDGNADCTDSQRHACEAIVRLLLPYDQALRIESDYSPSSQGE
jgi:hypothetical protein